MKNEFEYIYSKERYKKTAVCTYHTKKRSEDLDYNCIRFQKSMIKYLVITDQPCSSWSHQTKIHRCYL